MMEIAPNGQTFMQIPQPVQSCSSITASFLFAVREMHGSPSRLTGQFLMHSRAHFSGLQRLSLTTAIRIPRLGEVIAFWSGKCEIHAFPGQDFNDCGKTVPCQWNTFSLILGDDDPLFCSLGFVDGVDGLDLHRC